jgi:hypothetical protein
MNVEILHYLQLHSIIITTQAHAQNVYIPLKVGC